MSGDLDAKALPRKKPHGRARWPIGCTAPRNDIARHTILPPSVVSASAAAARSSNMDPRSCAALGGGNTTGGECARGDEDIVRLQI
jgi:hypothetical protein